MFDDLMINSLMMNCPLLMCGTRAGGYLLAYLWPTCHGEAVGKSKQFEADFCHIFTGSKEQFRNNVYSQSSVYCV